MVGLERAVLNGKLSAAADALRLAETGSQEQRDEARLLRAQLWATLGYPSVLCPRAAADGLARRGACPALDGRAMTARLSGATNDVKMMLIGDAGVGKTTFLFTVTIGAFPGEWCPVLFDAGSTMHMIDGYAVSISLWDTAGQADYVRLRPLGYPSTDIFIIAYSVDRRASFEAVAHSWMPELAYHHSDYDSAVSSDVRRGDNPEFAQRWHKPYCEGSLLPPIALLGLRTDLADVVASELSPGATRPSDFVTTEEGMELAQRIGASYFDECSARCDDPERDLLPILHNCARLALAAANRPRTKGNGRAEARAAAKAARNCERRHKRLLHAVGELPSDWQCTSNLRISACRQRLAFGCILNSRLVAHTCNGVAELSADIVTTIGIAALFEHPFPANDEISLRIALEGLRGPRALSSRTNSSHCSIQ